MLPTPDPSSECTCIICHRRERLEQAERVGDYLALAGLARELMLENSIVAEDRDYLRSVRNGSWPAAIEILEGWIRDARGKVADWNTAREAVQS